MREELIDLASVEDTQPEPNGTNVQSKLDHTQDVNPKSIVLDKRYEDAWKSIEVSLLNSASHPVGEIMGNKVPPSLLPGSIISTASLYASISIAANLLISLQTCSTVILPAATSSIIAS